MRFTFSVFPFLFLIAFACGSTWASSGDAFNVGAVRRSELRDAVASHRAAQREEIRREEAVAGRRLTAAELFELRQQVRGQWTPPGMGGVLNSAESQPAERIAPAPMSAVHSLTAPHSQRP